MKKHVGKNMGEKHCKKKHEKRTCVLAVRDDELSVGDDEDTSEACEKKTCKKTMHEKHA